MYTAILHLTWYKTGTPNQLPLPQWQKKKKEKKRLNRATLWMHRSSDLGVVRSPALLCDGGQCIGTSFAFGFSLPRPEPLFFKDFQGKKKSFREDVYFLSLHIHFSSHRHSPGALCSSAPALLTASKPAHLRTPLELLSLPVL